MAKNKFIRFAFIIPIIIANKFGFDGLMQLGKGAEEDAQQSFIYAWLFIFLTIIFIFVATSKYFKK